jgi:hypothetical protein
VDAEKEPRVSDTRNGDWQVDAPSPTFWERHSDRILGAWALGVLAAGTVVYHFLESWSWVDSFYFSSVAVSTVGFGDMVPSTDASKLFTVFYIFSGITIITVWLNMRLKRRATHVEQSRNFASDSGTPVLPPNVAPPRPDAAGSVNRES